MPLPQNVSSKAPAVTGKSDDPVVPRTYIAPWLSVTMLDGTSRLDPPKTVLYSSAVPSGLNTDSPQSNGAVPKVISVLMAPAVVG